MLNKYWLLIHYIISWCNQTLRETYLIWVIWQMKKQKAGWVKNLARSYTMGNWQTRVWNSNSRVLCLTPAHLNSCLHSGFLLLAVTLCFPSSSTKCWGRGALLIKAQEIEKCLDAHFIARFPLSSLSFSFFLLKSKRRKNLAPFPSCRSFWVSQMLWAPESRHSCLPPLFINAAVAMSSRRQTAGAVGGRAE